jgi:hypothetical protein
VLNHYLRFDPAKSARDLPSLGDSLARRAR